MNLVLLLALFTGDSMTVQAGQVIVIKSDVPAAWAVYPSDWPYFNVDETFVAGAGLVSREITVYKSTTKDGKPAIDATVVKIVGPDGPTPPGPKPPTPPVPPPTPPLSELSSKVRSWLAEVDDPAKAEHQAALASNFRSIASAIAAGALKEVKDIQSETSRLNREALGESMPVWDGWLTKLAYELGDMAMADGLNTPAKIATVWEQIAKGLD